MVKNNIILHTKKRLKLNWVKSTHEFFLQKVRLFDINAKTHSFCKNIIHNNLNFQGNISLPLVPLRVEGSSKIKWLFNSLKLTALFSEQKSFLKRTVSLQHQKKRSSGFVIGNKISPKYFLKTLYYFSLTILPFLSVSSIEKFKLLSSTQGDFSFYLKDVSFFSHILDENFINWEKPIFFDFNLKLKCNNILISSLLKRIIWSSLGLQCFRGQTGWLLDHNLNKFVIENKYNYKFYWLI